MTSILDDIKHMLGITPEETAFDTDIINGINGAFGTLTQLGVGPQLGYEITSRDNDWAEFYVDPRLNAVRTYVFLRTKIVFDPPTTGFTQQAMERQITELEFRLNVVVDYDVTIPISPPDPIDPTDPTGPSEPGGSGSGIGGLLDSWQFKNTNASPQRSTVTCKGVQPAVATEVFFDVYGRSGQSYANVFRLLPIGSFISAQSQSNRDSWIRYEITAQPVVVNGVATFSVTPVATGSSPIDGWDVIDVLFH